MALAEPIKKGGRYTKKEQEERRSEVYRLNFEYGYSARKISEMMKINRNTINRDIKFLYSKLAIDFEGEALEDWLYKQLMRLESQRARIRNELDSDITLHEKLQIEKMILDLDSKISNLIIKMDTSQQSHMEFAAEYLNIWMEEKGYQDRYITKNSLYTIPEKSREKIFKLLENN